MIKYNIKRSIKRKNIQIKVVTSREIEIKAPLFCSQNEIQRIIIKNKKWLQKTIAKLKEKEHLLQPIRYISGDKLLFLGKHINLKIVFLSNSLTPYKIFNKQNPRKLKPKSHFEDNILKISFPYLIPDMEVQKNIKLQIQKFYQTKAKEILIPRLQELAQKYNFNPATIRIKNQKSRWGSCSSKKNINLNYHLIKTPESIIDYVIIHELCHLKHLNHSKEFWNLLKSIQPNYKTHIKWLKENFLLLI